MSRSLLFGFCAVVNIVFLSVSFTYSPFSHSLFISTFWNSPSIFSSSFFFFHSHSLITTSFNFPGVRIFKILFFKPQHSLKGRKKNYFLFISKIYMLKIKLFILSNISYSSTSKPTSLHCPNVSSATVSFRFKSLRSEFASYFTCQIQSFSRSY